MIRRFASRVRGRLAREREALRLRRTAQRAGRAARALPPIRGLPADRAAEAQELFGRLARDLTLGHLTRIGLQTDSAVIYESLARRASRGRLALEELVALTEQGTSRIVKARTFDPAAVVALARVMQQHHHPDTGRVLALAVALRGRTRRGSLLLLAQLLILEQRDDDARALLRGIRRLGWEGERLSSDLLNPFTGGPGSEEEWVASLRGVYRGTGVEALRLSAPGSGDPFDRLTAGVTPGSVLDGPLVSVIMSTFRPDAAAISSARSILDQSWANLELLVMDDASGPEYDALLTELAALDERVRVVRAEENGGTYVRRNEGLRLARGEFVTMQDSDDWSHPRRLELQLRHLAANPTVPANLIISLRISSQLSFTQQRGLQPRLCEPSLMFRRALVTERIGYFDSVRRSADSEYRLRISRAFGVEVPVIHVAAPLMLMRFDRASLSGGDFGDGWTHPSRFAYRSAFLRWQGREQEEGRVPSMSFPLEERPFPAPARISGAPVTPRRFRIVVAGDGRWETPEPVAWRILATLRALQPQSRAGELAFLQLGSLRSAEAHLLAAPIQDLINEGMVKELSLTEEAEIDLIVVAHSDAVLGLPRGRGTVRARRVLLLMEPGAASRGGRGYAAELAEQLSLAAFGVVPEWRRWPGSSAEEFQTLFAETDAMPD